MPLAPAGGRFCIAPPSLKARTGIKLTANVRCCLGVFPRWLTKVPEASLEISGYQQDWDATRQRWIYSRSACRCPLSMLCTEADNGAQAMRDTCTTHDIYSEGDLRIASKPAGQRTRRPDPTLVRMRTWRLCRFIAAVRPGGVSRAVVYAPVTRGLRTAARTGSAATGA